MISKTIRARPEVAQLESYVCARDLYKKAGAFLDANENPFGSAVDYPGVSLNRYPDSDCTELAGLLGGYCGAGEGQLLVGNGSDDIISIAASAFCGAGDNVVTVQPGYSMWGVRSQVAGATERQALMTRDFELDVDAVLDCVDSDTRIVFLASPDAATGRPVGEASIRRLAREFNGMVFVDEAYFEFCGKTVRPLVDEFANLIVSRTLSKAWGLAALRVGYCISSPGAIKVMRKIRFPYGVGTLSQILASKALREGKARMLENVSAIMAERERLSGGLRRLGLEVFPGQANFVLVRFPEGISSKEVQGRLAEEASIIVRDRSSLPMLGNCIRITVGTGEENRRLAAELGRILGKSFDGI